MSLVVMSMDSSHFINNLLNEILKMKKYTAFKKYAASIGAVILAASSFTANAGIINVGGVTWDPDYNFGGPPPVADLAMNGNFSQWFVDSAVAGTYNPNNAKDVLTVGLGDELQGSGRITAFNGFFNPTLGADAGFCLTCELTYSFGGLLSDGLGGFTFANAFINFYVETGAAIDGFYTAGAAASTWLELSIDTLDFTAQTGVGQYIDGAVAATASATGGLAFSNFNTNTVINSNGSLSDVAYSADAIFGLENSTLAYNAVTNRYLYTNVASANLTGNTISEPGMLALLGLSLLAIGGIRRKNISSKKL